MRERASPKILAHSPFPKKNTTVGPPAEESAVAAHVDVFSRTMHFLPVRVHFVDPNECCSSKPDFLFCGILLEYWSKSRMAHLCQIGPTKVSNGPSCELTPLDFTKLTVRER